MCTTAFESILQSYMLTPHLWFGLVTIKLF